MHVQISFLVFISYVSIMKGFMFVLLIQNKSVKVDLTIIIPKLKIWGIFLDHAQYFPITYIL